MAARPVAGGGPRPNGAGGRRDRAEPSGSAFSPGDAVVHARFGLGVVVEVEGEGEDARDCIRFPSTARNASCWRSARSNGRRLAEPTDQ